MKKTKSLPLILILTLAVSLANFSLANGDLPLTDWPMFRNDLQHTGASTGMSPGSTNLQWVFNTSAEVHNSLAAADGMIFVAAGNGNVYAINSSTGKQIWVQLIGNSIWSSPAVSSSRLYVGNHDHNLYCLDKATGDILWKFLSNKEINSSPLVSAGKVFFNTVNGTAYCLNAETGSPEWTYDYGVYSFASPAMIDENTLVITAGNVFSIDVSTGHLNWKFNSAGLDNSPAIADGKIFASSKSMLMCFDAATGSSVWNTSFPDSRMGPLYYSSPAVADGMVFVHSCASANNFLGINATTGHIVWSSTVGSYDFCSSPAAADGRVFIGGDDGKLYCFNAVNGEIIWSYHTGDSIRASPIVAYGNVYVGSTLASGFSPTGQVYAFGAVPLAKTILSLSLSSQTSLGFSVGLNGNLLMENQSAVFNAPIKFSYSINDGSSWTDISLTYTSTDGSYSALWTPSATGVFLVKASYTGLYPYQSSQTSVQLSVLPYNNQYVFAVSSNSTVSSLAFNSQSNTLSFNVSGPSGTTGYVDMQIAKNLVSNIANLVITLDGNNLAYTVTSTSDSYLLHFSYAHSTHTVSINLGALSTQTPTTSPTANPTLVIPEIYEAIIIILILAVALVFVFYKMRSSKSNRG